MQTPKEFIEQVKGLSPIPEIAVDALVRNYVEGHYLLVFDLLWLQDPKQVVSDSNERSSLYDVIYDYLWDEIHKPEE